jgi:hypothetical protein
VRIANAWVEPADGYSSSLSAVFALPPPEKAAAVPFPSPDAIGRYARLGANLPIQLAEERSRQCFFHARQLASRAAAQLCVVLDDAFLYSRSAPPSVLTMYFDDVVVALRHSSALDIEPNDALLRRLRQASFAALMAEFRGAAVEPPANENAASTPLPPPQSNSGRSRRNTPS